MTTKETKIQTTGTVNIGHAGDTERKTVEDLLSENARVVLNKRYLRRNKKGEVTETPEGMIRRVAKAIAQPELLYGTDTDAKEAEEQFFDVMSTLDFVPNSPTLMNAGTGAGTLSACFVIGLDDSMESIMTTAKEAAMVQKFGGGTGFSLSGIRPKGAPIATTHGKACGPIAVLRHLSSVSTLVTQGGKRDGANMAVMDVHHPDILEFIDCKQVEGQIHNFNISVGASDEFMTAVKEGTDYELRDPKTGEVTDRLDAREVFAKIVNGAWRNGEPGMIFLDAVNRDNPTLNNIGPMTATNPCGEQPLLPYESCNLGSINLANFLVETDGVPTIDWARLRDVVRTTTRFLDNVIDANAYSVDKIEKMTKSTRKIGLGIMGFADMLMMMRIPYDSEQGVELGRKVMKFIRDESDSMSTELAESRGVFPAFKGSKYDAPGQPKMRNACRLTVAPTGTISMIAGCSSGCEPAFSLSYHKHNILGGESLIYVDKTFSKVAREEGFYSDDLMKFLADGGSIQDRDDVPDWAKRVFVTAGEISPEWHVRMQGAFQESVDSGISKTINFPNSATIEDVQTAYELAWELGCKGITVYRSGSREKEVLTAGSQAKEGATAVAEVSDTGHHLQPRQRPATVTGITDRIRTGHGNMYVTVNFDESGHPFELFTALGKAGGCDSAQLEAVSRLVSLALRSGIDPDQVVEQLRGITCDPVWEGGTLVRSTPDAVSIVLARHLEKQAQGKLPSSTPVKAVTAGDDTTVQPGLFAASVEMNGNGASEHAARPVIGQTCPECTAVLAAQEGCLRCLSCGYSKCD
ncbi:MAG: vitamin B12-dependent ribonucleotide reductase [Chloroflexi bacterium]|nr:vitamin B12-dependent ribonucleotide reductase [Chloroflexota bacterium]